MPYYTYKCSGCETQFDLVRKISEMNDPAVCPKCGSADCKKIIVPMRSGVVGDSLTLEKRIPGWFKEKSNALSKTFKNSKMPTF